MVTDAFRVGWRAVGLSEDVAIVVTQSRSEALLEFSATLAAQFGDGRFVEVDSPAATWGLEVRYDECPIDADEFAGSQ